MNERKTIYYVKTVLSAIGISLLLKLPVVSIYPLFLWMICMYLYRQETVSNKRQYIYTWIGAALFSAMLSLGMLQEVLGHGWKVAIIQMVFIFSGSVLFLQWALTQIFILLDNTDKKKLEAQERKIPVRRVFGVSYVVMVVLWIPVWLAHAPALMNSDTIDQIQQALGMRPVSNHHPAVHTLLMRGIYRITCFLGIHDIEVSFGIMGVLQLLLMAAVCAGAATYVYYWKRNKCLFVLMIMFYGMVAYNAYYSITLWKDTLHAGITVVFLILLHAYFSTTNRKGKLLVAIFCSGLLFSLFRSNGVYALLLWGALLLAVILKNVWIKKSVGVKKEVTLLLTIGGILAMSLIIKGSVYSAMEIDEPVITEKLSIPLQQVACVVANNRELSAYETEMINRIAWIDGIRENYVDYISDPIKSWVAMCGRRDYLKTYKWEYLRLWISLGMKYPKDYLFAWINQTKGYWYPNTSYWVYFGTLMENDLGLTETPIISWDFTHWLDKWVERYKEIPLYGSLWNLGVYSWGMILLELYALYKKKWGDALLVALPICLWGTLLISTPVYAEFRYLYAVILSMPLLVGLLYGRDCKTSEGEELEHGTI